MKHSCDGSKACSSPVLTVCLSLPRSVVSVSWDRSDFQNEHSAEIHLKLVTFDSSKVCMSMRSDPPCSCADEYQAGGHPLLDFIAWILVHAASRDPGAWFEMFLGCCFSGGCVCVCTMVDFRELCHWLCYVHDCSLEAMSDLTCLLMIKCDQCFSQTCHGKINASIKTFCCMGQKSLNLCVKPGICFCGRGHKACSLEDQNAFSLWPYNPPLIVISYCKPTYSYSLYQYMVRMHCEHVLKCAVLPLQADPALGYVMYLQEERSLSVVQQQNGCCWVYRSLPWWSLIFKLQPGYCLSSPYCSAHL